MELKLRKFRNRLVCSGWGIIILGLWPVIQYIMFVFLMPEAYNDTLNAAESFGDTRTMYITQTVLTLALTLLFHLLAGFSAVKSGKNNKKSVMCIIFGVIVLVLNLSNMALYLVLDLLSFDDSDSWLYCIITLFTIFVSIELLVSAFYTMSARKKLSKSVT